MKISVWVDRESEQPVVIVSQDVDGASSTLRVFRETQMVAAKRFARQEARKRGCEAVIESGGIGIWETL